MTTNLAMEELEPGCRLVDGKVVVVKEEVEGDKSIPGDRRTALVIQEIANSVCKTIRMTIDCPSSHESGWMPLLDLQVRVAGDNTLDYKFGADLKVGEVCGQPECELCASVAVTEGLEWPTGVVIKGTCKLCEPNNISATYFGESGFSGYYRSQVHKKEIIDKDLENVFAKHLQIHHPEQEGNPYVFNITVMQTFRKPLPRQTTEAVFIFNNNADIKMNSKTEFR